MSAGDSTWHLRTVFGSRLGAHLRVMDEVVCRLKSFGWCEQDIFGIELALEEALTNAIRHGNKADETKFVSVDCDISQARFWARICDEGDGFRPDDVPDPTEQANLTAIGGRGLLLIRTYMTEVCYNASGNCVTLLKVRP